MDCKSLGLDLTVRAFFDGPGTDRRVTLVKEDKLGGKLGELGGDRGVTLVKEGEPGEVGEPGELGGPGGIANPTKLCLISFNNFITPSS